MNNLITATADQLRFCKVGIMFYSSCNYWDRMEWNGKDRLIEFLNNNTSFNGTVKVNPEEFTASVLANIEIWFPEVCGVKKFDSHDYVYGLFADEDRDEELMVVIGTNPAPWLDSYEFRKVDGKWVMTNE